MRVFARKDVVDEVFDSRLEISVEEARAIDPNYQLDDVVEMEVTPKRFRPYCCTNSKTSRHSKGA